jgi:hypothetical protein
MFWTTASGPRGTRRGRGARPAQAAMDVIFPLHFILNLGDDVAARGFL